MPFPAHPELQTDELARIYLWETAICEARLLLDLASRAWAAKDMPEVQARDAEYMQRMHEAIQSRPDYEPGVQKLSHFREFELANPRPPGDAIDFHGFYDACRMLAVIFACQIFKSGYEERDVIAGNSRHFIEKHLGRLQDEAGFTEVDRIMFGDLRKRLETARDAMLAHADGQAFEFREIPAGFHFKHPVSCLDGIDFDLLRDFMRRLEDAIGHYLRQPAV
jgi:hypothetical protein